MHPLSTGLNLISRLNINLITFPLQRQPAESNRYFRFGALSSDLNWIHLRHPYGISRGWVFLNQIAEYTTSWAEILQQLLYVYYALLADQVPRSWTSTESERPYEKVNLDKGGDEYAAVESSIDPQTKDGLLIYSVYTFHFIPSVFWLSFDAAHTLQIETELHIL